MNNQYLRQVAAIVLALFGANTTPFCISAHSQLYKITDLGIFARPEMGLNNYGQVCGTTSDYQAFVWTNGVTIKLGTLGPLANGDTSFALGINDSGEIVGNSYDAFLPNPQPRAILFSAGKITDLGTLSSAVQPLQECSGSFSLSGIKV